MAAIAHRRFRHPLVVALGLALAAPGLQAQTPPAAEPRTASAGEPAPATMELRGVRVDGVGEHPALGITPAGIDALAERALVELGGPLPARVSFSQIEQVSARITAAYQDAGFLVARAIIPPQELGEDRILRLQVIEGRVGRVLVQGSERYRDGQLSASSLGLIGRPLRLQELERAVLYARDLPGVSVTSVLQPGEHTGETDIVLIAEDSARPYEISAGLSNHGTDSTGRYRAELGLSAFNALGLGDRLAASVGYGIDPSDSWQAALSLSVPVAPMPGLSGIVGVSRSELELNTGPFAALEIHGPTTMAYAGADWKFVQQSDLQAQASARWIREQSRLDGLGIELSRHEFDVLEAGVSLRHTDRRLRGINLVQASVRHAVDDHSPALNWLYPAHTSDFLVSRISLARLQALPGSQRLLLRASAQFTGDALVPMEQFGIGGPGSVRAYPLSSALGDRGVSASIEYQIEAPGFADRASPFGGRRWGDLVTLGMFYDWGRTSPASANRQLGLQPTTLEGAGLSLGLRLPWQPDLQLDLSAATPTGRTAPADDDVQVWARIGLTF